MLFPNFKNKQANDSFFSPAEFIEYKKKRVEYDRLNHLEGIILCYSRHLIEYISEQHEVTAVKSFSGEMHLLNETDNRVGIIGNFGFGAPIVVTVLEELIAFGVKRFISIGLAGTLQKNLKAGDVVVCEKAIRDEGTSYHYLEPSKYAYPSKEITDGIKRALDRQGQKYSTGTSWTIDAPFRETVAEVRQYQEEGVATVEMEASALFAVAQYRDARMGAMLTISDSLAGLEWAPEFHFKETMNGLEILCRAALEALSEQHFSF
ncbi:nucleoside phosphorylase [Chloroflexota bacterium]